MNEEPIIRPPLEEEVFQRVWQRVMEGRESQSSPIETTPPALRTVPNTPDRWVDGDLSCNYLELLSRTPPMIEEQDRPITDLPQIGMDLPARNEDTARLRQQTLEALEAWQFYRHLARRTRGNSARVLANLATDQHQLARKLAAAYFLHSGVRYWPSEQLSAPTITSYWGALRQRHQAEQQAELNYRMAMDDVEDSDLFELYGELSDVCRFHCKQLRNLLEQSCP